MSETRDAQILANWLDGSPSGAIPDTLDADVAEAIIALKPEYAPPHSIGIDDVLNSLTDGPLLDPEVGDALRAWLEAGPGTKPPSILPIGIVETTYALRPEMAPALGVGIDDILGALTEGPLVESNVVPLQSARPPTASNQGTIAAKAMHSPRRKWWTGTAVTVTAVAATTLLFVGPVADEAMNAPSPFDDGAVAQANAPIVIENTVELLEEDRVLEVDANEPEEDTLQAASSPPPAPSRRTTIRAAPARTSSPSTGSVNSAAVPPTAISAAPPAPRSARPMIVPESAVIDQPASVRAEAPTALGVLDAAVADADEAVEGEGIAEFEAAIESADGAGYAAAEPETAPTYKQKSQIDFDGMDSTAAGSAEAMGGFESRRPRSRSGATRRSMDTEAERSETRALRSEHRARTLFENGDFEQALTAVQSGLTEPSINPIRKARMLRLKAKILAKLGRETEAKQAREEAARIDPLR